MATKNRGQKGRGTESRSAEGRGDGGQKATAHRSRATVDHDQIRRWAEERGGHPAQVIGTGSDEDPGILRIDFPGYSGEGRLEEISWDEFFKKFDENDLALVYQEETSGGDASNFNKLVNRDSVEITE